MRAVPATGSRMSRAAEAELLQRALDSRVTGARLLTDDIDDLLLHFGYGPELNEEEVAESKSVAEREEVRAQLRDELQWLRRPPPAPPLVSRSHHTQISLSFYISLTYNVSKQAYILF
ncbi:uncharacterized protein LOC113493756 [Trichoplusia ni]|uniref:Uncharacterized protein LOC113493756 n=1 Tax=Trichoplusia ni TaxID=7111 RepID=A0A7E5VGW4_TRINI|nr:uncharacterized protein LOC113493756 [Trichoplusia ni]